MHYQGPIGQIPQKAGLWPRGLASARVIGMGSGKGPRTAEAREGGGSYAPAVSVEGLSKCYRVFKTPRARLAQSLIGQRKRLYREVWALRNVTFSLQPGQCLGVVGRNGSGKSTLLQILCGTLLPSEGSVKTQGRIGALLELGSGFNPDFTGLENIYLNGSLLGLNKRDVDNKLDAILGFADIGDFIDQPIRNYSSGMAVRLAFAVQAQTDPDILIVDEALAVGDEMFQRKCYSRLEQMRENGCSVLLVTHHCPTVVQHCDQALLLHKGVMRLQDAPNRVTALYQQLAQAEDVEWDRTLGETNGTSTEPRSKSGNANVSPRTQSVPSTRVMYPPRGAEILDGYLVNEQGERCEHVAFNEEFSLRFRYRATQDFTDLGFGCHLADPSGRRYTGQVFPQNGQWSTVVAKGSSWDISFYFRGGLLPGTYFVGAGLWSASSKHHFVHRAVDLLSIRIDATDAIPRVGTCDLIAHPPSFVLAGINGEDQPC